MTRNRKKEKKKKGSMNSYLRHTKENGGEKKMKNITNPMEFASVHRNATVTMENRFTCPSGQERGEEPLKLFGKWGHVKVSLIDSERNALSYRIYPSQMGIIRRRSDACILENTLHPAKKAQAGNPALMQLQGKYKGLSAAAALQKYGQQEMINQRNFLSQHLNGQYADMNKKQIAAINAALDQAARGALDASGSEPVLIFDSGLRGQAHNGVANVTQFKIEYNPGANMPFVLKMRKWLNVPVVEQRNGSHNFKMSGQKPVKTVCVSLQEGEWANMLDEIMDQIHLHKIMMFPSAYQTAAKMQQALDNAWRQQNQQRQIPNQQYQQNNVQSYDEYYDSYDGNWN